MSVAEIGQLHGRYVRVSDKFKALWTYNQFATGVFKNLLQLPVPYRIDFQKVYEGIRVAGESIQSVAAPKAGPLLDESERELRPIITQLVAADEPITASVLRRFFEKLRRQDDKIIYQLIKFYLYADATTGDRRDKLDFLFTRIGEDFVENRSEYVLKDTSELRKLLQGLMSVRNATPAPSNEVFDLVKTIRALKREIQNATAIEELTSKRVLENARNLKHNIGELFFEPDVLLAIMDCNITTKNAFQTLYQSQEQQIVEDSRRLLEGEKVLSASVGANNPELLNELARFKRFKKEFDDSRARSDVKHQVVSQLKTSMNHLLVQLDRILESPAEQVSARSIFSSAEDDEITTRFGEEPLLYAYLEKIHSILNYFDPSEDQDTVTGSPAAKNLRLENWEVDAFRKLFLHRRKAKDETDEMLTLLLRAAALRLKIEEEAPELRDQNAQVDPTLLDRVRYSLERSKELDDQFGAFLTDGHFNLTPKTVHNLYRSRLRLMRSFSGLWLLFDQHIARDPQQRSQFS